MGLAKQICASLRLLIVCFTCISVLSPACCASDGIDPASEPTAEQGAPQPNPQSLSEANACGVRATQLIAEKNFTAAIQKLKEGIALNPDSSALHCNLLYCYINTSKFPQAVEEGRTAVKLDSSEPSNWLNLASACQAAGKIEESRESLSEFLRRFPDHEQRNWVKSRLKALKKTAGELEKRGTGDAAELQQLGQLSSSKKWRRTKMPLSVYIADASEVDGYKESYKEALLSAFQTWQDNSDGRLSFEFTDSPKHSDIQCSWTSNAKKLSNSSEAGEAKVTMDQLGIIHKAHIVLLTQIASAPPVTNEQAREIALHEVGHAIGLSHSFNTEDIMFYTSRLQPLTTLSSNDASVIQRLYRREDPPVPIPVASPGFQFSR